MVLAELRRSKLASWGPELDRLLAGRTLAVAYRPILERQRATTRGSLWSICGSEALLRARADRRPPLPPDKYRSSRAPA